MILLTGHTGFVGSYALKNFDVFSGLEKDGELVNITDYEQLRNTLDINAFQDIIHLAAQSHVQKSFEDPKETFDINFWGTWNLLRALKDLNFKGKLLYVSTGDVYGVQERKLTESIAPKPQNPYAISKLAAEGLCHQFNSNVNFKIIIARPFNHTASGQSSSFVLPSFSEQIINTSKVKVGNIEISRDFSHVHDVISAYLKILERGIGGEIYNIASGNSYLIKDLLLKMIGYTDTKIEIETDASLFRLTENPTVSVDISKVLSLGWSPRYSIDDILKELLTTKK